jgi:Flp pilus assembly pilin Flp
MKKTVHKLMFTYLSVMCRLEIWRDNHGQDLIEYALMAGFVAVAAVSTSISKIFSRVSSVMTAAAS